MPNHYVKAEKFVGLALAALERETILPNIVTRFDGGAFKGAEGDTVTYRTGAITKARDYEFRTRTAPIVLDEIYRTKLPITLNTHTYSANGITDEELTLDITDFASEVVQPQVEAVRDRLEGKVSAKLAAESFKVTNLNATGSGGSLTDAYRWALNARAKLNQQGTPRTGRILLVGSNAEPWLLDHPKLISMDPDQAQTAFREAQLGRMAGFSIVSSELIDPNALYALHPTWAVLANVAPDIPDGVTYGARRSYKGYGLRVIKDYDPNFLRDRSVVSTFTGISAVHDEYLRYVTADLTNGSGGTSTIPSGFAVGDIKVVDGEPQYTAVNVRGAKGTFTP